MGVRGREACGCVCAEIISWASRSQSMSMQISLVWKTDSTICCLSLNLMWHSDPDKPIIADHTDSSSPMTSIQSLMTKLRLFTAAAGTDERWGPTLHGRWQLESCSHLNQFLNYLNPSRPQGWRKHRWTTCWFNNSQIISGFPGVCGGWEVKIGTSVFGGGEGVGGEGKITQPSPAAALRAVMAGAELS
jgi:hypothetical protein